MSSILSARVVRNFRDAARQLRRDPAYSAILIATMTIGIASAAAIFSVVRGVVLRPLPYRQPEALVSLQEYQRAVRRDQTSMSSADFNEVRASAKSFEALSAFSNSEFVLSDGAEAERVVGATVDADLFPILGTPPLLGRAFESGEVGDSPARVAIMSYALWRRRYGSERRIIGRSIVVDGNPYTVIGVMPERFEFPRNSGMDRDIELWTPRRTSSAMMMRRAMRSLTVLGRIRPGVSDGALRSELAALSDRLERGNPQANGGWSLRVVPIKELMIGNVRQPLLMLFACVLALLVIVCVNASAAALARMVSRRQSLGVRVALGASQSSLSELLLSESTFLALIAGALALPLSAAIRSGLMRIAPVAIPRQNGVANDLATLMFTLIVALVVGAITALAPALWLRGLDVRTVLTDSDRGLSGSRSIRRSLGAFVCVQLAVGTILLGLTTRMYSTYAELNRVDPGFRAEGVTTASIALRGMRYQTIQARSAFTEQLLERVRAMPGVERAAVASLRPMSGGMMTGSYRLLGADSDSGATAAVRAVSSDFFQTAGIAVKLGRVITRSDDASAPLAVVVNEAMARQTLSGRGVIGATISVSAPGRDSAEAFQVVGVVADAKEKDLRSPGTPIIYFSSQQASFPHAVLMLRTASDPPVRAVRAALRDLDRTLALDDVGGLAAAVRETYALQIFLLIVLAAFAMSGVMLIAIGVYGSASFAVAADLRSIGVRIALGASPSMMLRAVLGRTLRLAMIGCGVGVIVLMLAPRATSLMAENSGRLAVGNAVIAALVIAAIAGLATLRPARRASGSDPSMLLRE